MIQILMVIKMKVNIYKECIVMHVTGNCAKYNRPRQKPGSFYPYETALRIREQRGVFNYLGEVATPSAIITMTTDAKMIVETIIKSGFKIIPTLLRLFGIRLKTSSLIPYFKQP